MKTSHAITFIGAAFIFGTLLSLNFLTKSVDLSQVQATVLTPPKALPSFSLTDHKRQVLTNDQLKGKWTLVFLGYTYCPDICPTTLNDLKLTQQLADAAGFGDRLRILFVSVDPDRDTPERLAQYVTYFDPRFEAATGSPDTLLRFAKGIGGIFKVHHDDDTENYPVEHSSGIAVLNAQGQWRAYFSAPHNPTQMVEDLKLLIQYDE